MGANISALEAQFPSGSNEETSPTVHELLDAILKNPQWKSRENCDVVKDLCLHASPALSDACEAALFECKVKYFIRRGYGERKKLDETTFEIRFTSRDMNLTPEERGIAIGVALEEMYEPDTKLVFIWHLVKQGKCERVEEFLRTMPLWKTSFHGFENYGIVQERLRDGVKIGNAFVSWQKYGDVVEGVFAPNANSCARLIKFVALPALSDDVVSKDDKYHIENWDVSRIKDMTNFFANVRVSNQPHFALNLGKWNVGGATSMRGMFCNCNLKVEGLSGWDVSAVKNMESMFLGAANIREDFRSWNVGKVTRFDKFSENPNIAIPSHFRSKPGTARTGPV